MKYGIYLIFIALGTLNIYAVDNLVFCQGKGEDTLKVISDDDSLEVYLNSTKYMLQKEGYIGATIVSNVAIIYYKKALFVIPIYIGDSNKPKFINGYVGENNIDIKANKIVFANISNKLLSIQEYDFVTGDSTVYSNDSFLIKGNPTMISIALNKNSEDMSGLIYYTLLNDSLFANYEMQMKYHPQQKDSLDSYLRYQIKKFILFCKDKTQFLNVSYIGMLGLYNASQYLVANNGIYYLVMDGNFSKIMFYSFVLNESFIMSCQRNIIRLVSVSDNNVYFISILQGNLQSLPVWED